MAKFRFPEPNTPKIIARKQKQCRKILICSLSLCGILIALFLLSINLSPRAPFMVSLSFLIAVVLTLVVFTILYQHIKLFPEFDYGTRTPKEISALPINPQYEKQRSQIRRRKLIKSLLIIFAVFLWLLPQALDYLVENNPFHTDSPVYHALNLLPVAFMILLTRSLAIDFHDRRMLEFCKYIG